VRLLARIRPLLAQPDEQVDTVPTAAHGVEHDHVGTAPPGQVDTQLAIRDCFDLDACFPEGGRQPSSKRSELSISSTRMTAANLPKGT